MVVLNKEKALFNYRVAGVAIHNGRVLLDRNTRNSYWVLPGGHPDLMEPMETALAREVKEEISEEAKIVRLLWIMENFFHKKKDIHELSFYFLMELPENSKLLTSDGPFYGEEHGHALIFQWFPLDLDILTNLPLFPLTLSKALLDIPSHPTHIVYQDIDTNNNRRRNQKQRLTIS